MFGHYCKSGANLGNDKQDQDKLLTTGEMARLSQTTLRTVRFYEAEGLLTPCDRDGASHRKFPKGELVKLQIIADLRDAGLSLQEIKDLIAVKAGCPNARSAANTMTSAVDTRWGDVERRIAALDRVRTELLRFKEMLQTCRECAHPTFPQRCGECEVADVKGAERTTQLLWKH
jgi:DNA-binding transcriptional MerR regulator